MIVHIYSDEHGLIYEPHGDEDDPRWVSAKGAEMMYQAGWHYVKCHRVSSYLHEILVKLGHLKPLGAAPPLERVMLHQVHVQETSLAAAASAATSVAWCFLVAVAPCSGIVDSALDSLRHLLLQVSVLSQFPHRFTIAGRITNSNQLDATASLLVSHIIV